MDILGGLGKGSCTQIATIIKSREVFKPLPLLYIFYLTTIIDVRGRDIEDTNSSLPDFVRDIYFILIYFY